MPARPSRVDQQRGEPLHPPIDRDVINGDTAFSQQLLNVPVGQSKAQIPADSHHDHIRRKPKPGETGPWRWYSSKAVTHRPTLPAPPSVNATDPIDVIGTDNSKPAGLFHQHARSSLLGVELERAVAVALPDHAELTRGGVDKQHLLRPLRPGPLGRHPRRAGISRHSRLPANAHREIPRCAATPPWRTAPSCSTTTAPWWCVAVSRGWPATNRIDAKPGSVGSTWMPGPTRDPA
jgi:hypothetical protein